MSTSTLADFEVLEQLGKGSYGVVFKVRRKVDDSIYVLKQISLLHLSAKEQSDCVSEVQLLASLDSPYIVRYFDSFLDANAINIIMEYCEQGDLHQKLRKQKGVLMEEERIWRYFIQMMLGLHALHMRRILHRDVKSLNLFLGSDASGCDQVKIGDLGVAKMLSSQSAFAHTTVGTPYYLSPELCEGKPYNEKSDVWAAGGVLYELCTLKHPFDAANQGALILKILRGKYPPLPTIYAASKLQRVLDACLRKDTALRPTVTQVLASQTVYGKARSLGIELPSQVEQLVASRKHTAVVSAQRAAEREAVGGASAASEKKKTRTQALADAPQPPSTFGLPSTIDNAATSSSAANKMSRTMPRKTRTRMGASSAVVGPIVSGVAPARPTPGVQKRKDLAGAKKKSKSSGTTTAATAPEAQSVHDLPDHVPGAPPSQAHQWQPSSFVPSPDPDSGSGDSFSGVIEPLLSPTSSRGVAVVTQTNKPSVSLFKQALSSSAFSASSHTPAVANTTNTHLNQTPAPAHVTHAIYAPPPTIPSQPDTADEELTLDDDDDEEYASDEDVDFSSPLVSAALTAGRDMDPDLIDTTAEQEDDYELSGSADEVQWRIIEHDAEERQQQEQLYDEDEDDEDDAPADSHDDVTSVESLPDHVAGIAISSPRLAVDEPFGLAGVTRASSSSSTTTSSATPRPHLHAADAALVFHAVGERMGKLRSHLASLRAEVVDQVGEAGATTLYDYFKTQASTNETAEGAAASTPAPLDNADSHLIDLLSSAPDAVTRVYQILYLEEEASRCEDILQMAHRRHAHDAAASPRVTPAAVAPKALLNQTPRPVDPRLDAAALNATGNLTLKRQALLHRKTTVSTASATKTRKPLVPSSTSATATTNANTHAALSKTIAPTSSTAAATAAAARQRRR